MATAQLDLNLDVKPVEAPFAHRLARRLEEYARLAVFMAENSYLNGEYVRLDGAIRMAPR